ncbi:hypothetical protein [Psychromonas arctica]|uniref:hypothetical protein n=1 Tax=Psychromonas arctica TaxID=168275 RepID=UPI0004225379|nr:hypothetical protein [Psychromonas arctica]
MNKTSSRFAEVIEELLFVQKKTNAFVFFNKNIDEDLKEGGDIDLLLTGDIQHVTTLLILNDWKVIETFYDVNERYFFEKIIRGCVVQLDFMRNLIVRIGKNNYYYQEEVKTKLINGGIYLSDVTFVSYYKFKVKLVGGEQKQAKLDRLLNNLCSLDLAAVNNSSQHYNKKRVTYSIFRKICSLLGLERTKSYILFVGVDGVGKGTYIDLLFNAISEKGGDVGRLYLGHNNYKLKLLEYLNGIKSEKRNKVIRLFYQALFPIELFYRGLVKNDCVLIDRHPAFESVSNGSFIYKIIQSMNEKISPTPSVIIHLSGDVKEIWKRKKEHSLEAMIAMDQKLSNEIKIAKGTIYTISTTELPIHEVSAQIERLFWNAK